MKRREFLKNTIAGVTSVVIAANTPSKSDGIAIAQTFLFPVPCGPSGGYGGTPFDDLNVIPGESQQLHQITVRAGALIDGFNYSYRLPIGETVSSPWHGGLGGNPHEFNMQTDEHLMAITGTYEEHINQIRFHTDKQDSPLYGSRRGTVSFHYQAPAGFHIVGFYGRHSRFIVAIGVYILSFTKIFLPVVGS